MMKNEVNNNAAERITYLMCEVERLEYAYYRTNKPAATDAEYDDLLHELTLLEQQYPELKHPASPTTRVGSDLNTALPVVKHKQPMLSMRCSCEKDEIEKFVTMQAAWSDRGYATFRIEPKLDGIPLELVYHKGLLVTASTRGDGLRGNDVTPYVRRWRCVPIHLNEADGGYDPNTVTKERTEVAPVPDELVIYGELCMYQSNLAELNRKSERNGCAVYAKGRHAVQAALNLPLSEAHRFKPSFLVWDVCSDDAPDPDTQNRNRAIGWGFEIVPGAEFDSYYDVSIVLNDVTDCRADWAIEADGVVIKLLFRSDRDCGNDYYRTGQRYWNYQMAYKFTPERGVVRAVSVKYTVGKTGQITPVLHTTPLNIGGCLCQNFNLHSKQRMDELGLKVGSYLLVELSGDTTPQIVEVVSENKARLLNRRYKEDALKFNTMGNNTDACGSFTANTDADATRTDAATAHTDVDATRTDASIAHANRFVVNSEETSGTIEEPEGSIEEPEVPIEESELIDEVTIAELPASAVEGEPLTFTATCPDCGEPLQIEGAHAYCNHFLCPTQKVKRLMHFKNTIGLKIVFTASYVRNLHEGGYLQNIGDFFKLSEYRLKQELGSTNGIVIERTRKFARNNGMSVTLASLAVPGLSKPLAKKIVAVYPSVKQLVKLSANTEAFEEVAKQSGVHPDICLALLQTLADPQTQKDLRVMEKFGIDMVATYKDAFDYKELQENKEDDSAVTD